MAPSALGVRQARPEQKGMEPADREPHRPRVGSAASGPPRPLRGALRRTRGTVSAINQGALYISVLVGGDCYELGLRKGEGLHSARLVGILRAVFVHLHHMQAGLVLVERLQNHHLSGRGKRGKGPRGEEEIRTRRTGRAMPAGGRTPAASPGLLRASPATLGRDVNLANVLRVEEARDKINGRAFTTTTTTPPFYFHLTPRSLTQTPKKNHTSFRKRQDFA